MATPRINGATDERNGANFDVLITVPVPFSGGGRALSVHLILFHHLYPADLSQRRQVGLTGNLLACYTTVNSKNEKHGPFSEACALNTTIHFR
jgi:hypothetical protein